MLPGFTRLDWSAPLDINAALTVVPPDVTVRGMFPQGVVDECVKAGRPLPGGRRYVGFKGYPVTEFMELCVEASALLFPTAPPRERLRRLGQLAYPTLLQSMVGKAIFGMVGGKLEAVMKLASKGYEVSLSRGTATAVEVQDGSARLHFRDIYNFLDTYQVGVVEGAMSACGRTGEVFYRSISPSEGEMLAQWR
ncbi:MAG: DUF2378 family protein [Myxococcota bacterium]